MGDVVLDGTGKFAQLDGYTAAGKTGTAQKIDPATGRYSRTNYIASFIGFAPVNNPAITILVSLDSPVGQHHGAEVGAPVWRRIAQQALAYLDVPHDVPTPSDLQIAKNRRRQQKPSPLAVANSEAAEARFQAAVERNSQHAPRTVAFGTPDSVAVPDMSGQTVRHVTETCTRLGLVPTLIGNGIALQQFPASGTSVLRGSQVTVRFGRPDAGALTRGGGGN